MIIIGVVFMICGGAAALWAHNMQNSFEYNWYAMWGSSDYSYVDVIFYIGIIAFIAGVVFLILGCTKQISQSNQSNHINGNTYGDNVPNFNVDKVICSKCGAHINNNATFCPNCGYENKPQISQQKYCGNCGNKITANAAFCPICGEKISKEE